jgi:hypothetical protein
VLGQVLDVADTGAVAGLAAELADRYGGVDIVVSNAIGALTPDRPQSEQADKFINVANGGSHAVLRSFGPVLRPGGRLIVMASSLRTLGQLDPRLHPLFDGATLEQVEAACLETSAPYASARRAAISPCVRPFADREITMSPTPVSRRCLLATIFGSKLESRSRGTLMSTGPASVSTVFARWPLWEFPPLRPTGSFFS